MKNAKIPLCFHHLSLLVALALAPTLQGEGRPDGGQQLRVSAIWAEPLSPLNKDNYDQLYINNLPEGMSIKEALLSCACPTTIAELRSYLRGLSAEAPWPILIDEERSRSEKRRIPVGFAPVVKLEGTVGYRVGGGSFHLMQGSEQIDCQLSDKRVLSSLPEGTRIRIVGVVAKDKLTGEIRLGFVMLDPEFKPQTFSDEASRANMGAWFDRIAEPLVMKPVKKASLKERKELGDLILQSAKIQDWTTVREAVEEGGLINTRNEYDHANVLTYALREPMPIEERRDLVQFLLERGAVPPDDEAESSSVPTLFFGVQSNDLDLVILLLRGGVRPGTQRFGIQAVKTPLQQAREVGNRDIVALLTAVLEVTQGAAITPEAMVRLRNNELKAQARNKGEAGQSQEPNRAHLPSSGDRQHLPDASAGGGSVPAGDPAPQQPTVSFPTDSIVGAFRAAAAVRGRLHGISGKDPCILEIHTVEGETFTGVYHDSTSGFPFSYTVSGKVTRAEASFTAGEWVQKPSIAPEADVKPGSGCSAEFKLEADGACHGKVRYKTWERSKLTLRLSGN